MLGIEIELVPVMVFDAPEKVCAPVLAVYVPLLVKLPANVMVALPFSVKVPLFVTSAPYAIASATDSVSEPPELMVTLPDSVFDPAVFVIDNVPAIIVVPVTPIVLAIWKVPELTTRSLFTVTAALNVV